MPRLGHAARIRAHIRPIEEHVRKVLEIAAEVENTRASTDEGFDSLEQAGIPWSYRRSPHSKQFHYDILPYPSWDMLCTSHAEILRHIEDWKKSGFDDWTIEKVTDQLVELSMMAWKLERIERGQDIGTSYLTFDADPLSMLLLALAGQARADQHFDEWERMTAIDKVKFRKTLKLDQRGITSLARRELQHMIDNNIDHRWISERYDVANSDIPGLQMMKIDVSAGSVRSLAISSGPVRLFSTTHITLGFHMGRSHAVTALNGPLSEIISHPLTNTLGLTIENVGDLTKLSNTETTTQLRVDGWRRKNLQALVINMKGTEP